MQITFSRLSDACFLSIFSSDIQGKINTDLLMFTCYFNKCILFNVLVLKGTNDDSAPFIHLRIISGKYIRHKVWFSEVYRSINYIASRSNLMNPEEVGVNFETQCSLHFRKHLKKKLLLIFTFVSNSRPASTTFWHCWRLFRV